MTAVRPATGGPGAAAHQGGRVAGQGEVTIMCSRTRGGAERSEVQA